MADPIDAVTLSPSVRLEDSLVKLERARGKDLIGVDGLDITNILDGLLGGVTINEEPVTTHICIPEGATIECENFDGVITRLDTLTGNLENIAAYGEFLKLIERNLEALAPDEIAAKNDDFVKLLKSKEVQFNNNADDFDAPKNEKNWLRRSIASFDCTMNNNPFKTMRLDWESIKQVFLNDDFFGARGQALQVVSAE